MSIQSSIGGGGSAGGVVGVTGTVGISGSIGVTGAVGITGPVGVTFGVASVTFPIQNEIGITGPVGVTFGVVGVTFPATSGTVGVTGAVGITGPVSVTFPSVAITGSVGTTFGVVSATFPAVANTGAIGITGPVSTTFGIVTATFPAIATTGAIGITGPVAVTFGVASVTFPVQNAIGITGPVAVTFGVASVTFVQAPGVTFGPVGISGVPSVTFGVVGNTGAIGITGPVAVTFGVASITFVQSPGVTFGNVGITGPVTVVGPAADGAAVSGNPVRIAGKDLSGNTQDLISDTTGRLWPSVGFVSTANSRANANLGSGATFAGTFEDITQFANINVGILDAGAAGGTLVINWSEDGSNIRDLDVVGIPTANGQQFSFGRKWQYYQVVYGHGAAAGNVVIQSILSTAQTLPSTHFGSDTITQGQDAQLVIAEMRALNGSNFVNVLADSAGNLISTLQKASTGTLANVSGSASSVTILAANSARLGATIFNDADAFLYLKYGTTASTTSFTVRLNPYDYYEVTGPYLYTGRIDGIWSNAVGAARVTENTA